MLHTIMKFLRDEEGAGAVEYGLIIGLIAVALVLVLTALGGGLGTLFRTACNSVIGAGTCA
ncbi:MAG: Flp family type IVb pilin [Gammaproteobacteria bacterium]